MSRETRRGGGGAGSARQSMADAAAFEKYEPQPTTSLRGAGRTSRNSGGLGLYSSPIAAPAAGTGTNAVSVNLGQIPSLPEFPAGYTLYMYRRPKWTQPKGPRKFAAAAKEAAHGGVNIGGVIVSGGDEGDENRTETESVDGEGAESLDGSVDDRKESAAGSASGAASGGPPPGAKISGWRSDTIMFGVCCALASSYVLGRRQTVLTLRFVSLHHTAPLGPQIQIRQRIPRPRHVPLRDRLRHEAR